MLCSCTATKLDPFVFVLLTVLSVLLMFVLHGVLTFGHFQADEELLKQHYAELKLKPFFPKLMKYMSSGPVVPMVC